MSTNLTDLVVEFFVSTDDVRVRIDFAGAVFVRDDEAAERDEDADAMEGARTRSRTTRRGRLLVCPRTGTLRSACERGRMMVDQKVCSGEGSVGGCSGSGGVRGRR